MSTKKILLIVFGIVGVLGLLVALFVGGIVWFVFHTINSSQAAETARVYLKNNDTLKQDIGEVKDFGYFVTGQINQTNANGEATLHLKVIGEKKTVNATVALSYRDNRGWRVTDATYVRDGQTFELMEPYEPPRSSSP